MNTLGKQKDRKTKKNGLGLWDGRGIKHQRTLQDVINRHYDNFSIPVFWLSHPFLRFYNSFTWNAFLCFISFYTQSSNPYFIIGILLIFVIFVHCLSYSNVFNCAWVCPNWCYSLFLSWRHLRLCNLVIWIC